MSNKDRLCIWINAWTVIIGGAGMWYQPYEHSFIMGGIGAFIGLTCLLFNPEYGVLRNRK